MTQLSRMDLVVVLPVTRVFGRGVESAIYLQSIVPSVLLIINLTSVINRSPTYPSYHPAPLSYPLTHKITDYSEAIYVLIALIIYKCDSIFFVSLQIRLSGEFLDHRRIQPYISVAQNDASYRH